MKSLVWCNFIKSVVRKICNLEILRKNTLMFPSRKCNQFKHYLVEQ